MGWDKTGRDAGKTPRADEVAPFRKLESPSGLQIANFRYAGSMFAFSADAIAHLLLCKRRGRGRRTPSAVCTPHTLIIAIPRIQMATKDGGKRADGKGSDLSNRDPKKIHRAYNIQCIVVEL